MPVVLLSGGMDSAISLFYAVRNYPEPVLALTFDYAQRHRHEVIVAGKIVLMAREVAQSEHKVYHRVIRLGGVMPVRGSLIGGEPVKKYNSIEDTKQELGTDPSFIPHRNLLFLTIAAQWAREYKMHEIITGLRGGFSDCTMAFEFQVDQMLAASDASHKVTVSSPVHRSRSDSILLAEKLPGCMQALGHTLTCFEGTVPPCGHCLPCLKRAEGFAQVGIPDPLLWRLGGSGEVLGAGGVQGSGIA